MGDIRVVVFVIVTGGDLRVAGVVPDDDPGADPLEPRGGVLADDAAEADGVPDRHSHHRLRHRHLRRARQHLGVQPGARFKRTKVSFSFEA